MAVWQKLRTLFRPSVEADTRGMTRVAQQISAPRAGDMMPGAAGERISIQDQFGKLKNFIEVATAHALDAQRIHATTRQRLDATEHSLRRMLADIEGIMRVPSLVSLEGPGASSETAKPRIALAA